MLQNKRANILIAFLASICLWAYVTGSVDPNITKKFTSVSVKLINEDSLLQDGLAVDSAEPLSIDVSIIGTRAQVNKLTNEDIVVTADLYGRNKGTNYVSLDVQLPKGMKVDSKSQDRIVVVIDDLVTEERDVEATVKGTLPENTTLGETTIDPENVMVYGTKDNVEKVKYIKATLNADDLTKEKTTQVAGVTPVDSNGKEVDFVSTSKTNVSVNASLVEYKEVKLNVQTTGEVDNKYEVESITIPDTVHIVGDTKTLSTIESISAEDVDISGVTNSTKIKVKPILPSGVKLKDEKKGIYVDVVIKAQEKKTVQFAGKEIEIRNLGDGLKGTIKTNISMVISGKKSALAAFKKSDVTLYIDANRLEEGEHELEVYVVNTNGYITESHTPTKVKVEISKE